MSLEKHDSAQQLKKYNPPPELILGLCCINNYLNNTFNIRARIIQRNKFNTIDAIEKARLNLEDVSKIIDENIKNNIKSFRMSSELLPRFNDPLVESYDMNQFQDLFEEIGEKALLHDIRLTFHPGQFVVLASDDEEKIQSSIKEIEYHCEILERMGVSPEMGVCNIHVGGLYEPKYKKEHDFEFRCNSRQESKKKVTERWCKNFSRLSERAKGYLTIENDEKIFNVEDCLKLADLCHVPVVYDTHHEECYIKLHPNETHIPVEKNLPRILETWTRKNKFPMAHISNQDPGKRVGAHSEFILRVPEILYDYAMICPNRQLWVDVEAKSKEEAIFAMRKNFNFVH